MTAASTGERRDQSSQRETAPTRAGPAADAGMRLGHRSDAGERTQTDDARRWTIATETDTDKDDDRADVDDASTPQVSKASSPTWNLES